MNWEEEEVVLREGKREGERGGFLKYAIEIEKKREVVCWMMLGIENGMEWGCIEGRCEKC